MENGRNIEKSQLSDNQLKSILLYGLVLSSISIIFSVDYLFKNGMWLELGVATCLFASIVILIRCLNK